MKLRHALASVVLLSLPSWAFGAGAYGEPAPDFPPGVFSDGGHYDLSDFKGKLLVIFFFESECPNCKLLVPGFNKIVAQYKDKPVKFLAVGPHNNLAGVKAYQAETKLAMPVFADNLNIMESMYGQTMSLKNVRQFRVVGPDGKVVGYDMTTEDLDKLLADVKWKFKDQGYDHRLDGIIDLLEWNQYPPALNQLKPLRKNANKALATSAEKLYQAVKSEADDWKHKADDVAATDPVQAFDLYSKISMLFAGDELAKSVADSLKSLKGNKIVVEEMTARTQYAQLYTAVPRARIQQKTQVVGYCESIAAKFPDTPTGGKAKSLSAALIGASVSTE